MGMSIDNLNYSGKWILKQSLKSSIVLLFGAVLIGVQGIFLPISVKKFLEHHRNSKNQIKTNRI